MKPKTTTQKLLASSKEAIRPFYLRWLYFPLFPARFPSHFSYCWNFPVSRPPPRAAGAAPDFLFLPMTDWHTRIQRTQHLARAFASRGQRCFYVNPHLGREFPKPYIFTTTPLLCQIEPNIAELHIHLPREPVFHDRLLSTGETDRILSCFRETVARTGSRHMVQIVSFPLWTEVARRIRDEFGFPIVYDCHDVLAGFRNIAPEIVDAEAELFSLSNLVLFSAESLLENSLRQFPDLQSRSLLVRNAVDERWLALAGDSTPHPEKIAGYMGALDFWFDVDAVEQAAIHYPDWKFLLIGRVEDERVRRLEALPTVVFQGEVAHSELHTYLERLPVALIPFIRNELTLGTNPIKLYEYFSYGLPVIASRLPELEQFGDLVYLSESPAGFVEQLGKASTETTVGTNTDPRPIPRRQGSNQQTCAAGQHQLYTAFQNFCPTHN